MPGVNSALILIIVFELRLKSERFYSFWSFTLDFWGREWENSKNNCCVSILLLSEVFSRKFFLRDHCVITTALNESCLE